MLQGITDSRLRFRVTAIFTMALTIMVVGVAYAAWTATGTGTGEATAGEALPLGIAPISAGELYPTVTVDLQVNVANDNPYNVSVHSIDIDLAAGGITVTAGDCDADHVTWHGPFDYDPDEFVVAADDDTNITLVDALTLENDAHDDCQSATFTVNLELSGESTAAGAATP